MVDALGRALKLDTDELEHLQDLVMGASRHALEPPRAPSRTVNPQATLLLESLRRSPAYVTSRTLDLLAHNPSALALYPGIEDWPAKQRNLSHFMFLHPAARDLYADWDTKLVGCVARLRARPAPTPTPPDLIAVPACGAHASQSLVSRSLWARRSLWWPGASALQGR